MATPSVLTVPSMYGDGILYSGPTVFSNELVTNGNFATDSDWTKQTGWTIANGKATCDGTNLAQIYQTNILTHLKTYKVTFSIVSIASGGVFVKLGADVLGVTQTEIGTYTQTFYFNSSNPSNLTFHLRSSNFNGSIDNVSVVEVTQGSDFDFTRATTGTRINEEGYIEDVPYNLLTYSTDFTFWTQADVSTVPIEDSFDGSGDAYKVSITGGTGFQTIRKTGLNLSGQQTFSIYAKKDTLNFTRILFGGFGNFWVDLANGTQGTTTGSYDSITITNAGNGFFRIVATFTATSPVTHIYLYPSTANGNVNQSSGSVIFQYAQLVKGDQPKDYLPTTDRVNLPRLNYPVYGGCPSLLVEPQRTNILPYSEDFSNSNWIDQSTDTTLSVVSSGSPDGGAFYRCTSGSNGGGRLVDVFSASLTGGVFSIYAKGSGSLRIDLFINGGGNVINTITLTSEWKRYDVYNPHTNSSGDVSIRFFANSVADIFGAQVESGSYATSYIPTSGSTVTRNEDKALYAGLGTTDTFNDSEGVLFIETEALVNEVNARGISINAGNGLNRVLISYPSSGNSSITGYLQSTAGSGAGMTITGIDTTQKHKVAIKYKLNDTSLFIDGVKRAVDTSVVMPVGLKQLDFSNGISVNTAEYEGNLNAIAVYKTALTDTELANLTSYNNHDLFIPYRSRMQMISADQELQCTEHDITRFL